MYKCKDCGKEYKEKTDYCDCGNNTFDYIEDIVPAEIPTPKKELSIEQKSEIISWIFLAICLITSLIVWLMPIKVEQTVQKEIKETKIDTKSIPNIEKIWDSTPVKIEIKEPEIINPLDTIRQEIPDKKTAEVTKPAQNKPVANNTKPQTVSKPVAQKPVANQTKTSTQTKQSTSQTKPVTAQPKQATTQTKTAATQPKQTTQSKPVTQNKQTANPNNLKPVQQTQKTQNKPAEKPVYNPNSPEMLKYKGSLRSALFAKLPVGSIQGSGSCSVQFAVDSTGKLINRAFSKQSDNKSLNDAVYYMLMSVPRFAAPPEGYNQELIRMNINMHSDGSYEISIN